MVVPLQESATQQMADVRLAQRESFQTGHTKARCAGNGYSIGKRRNAGMTRLEGF